MNDMYQLRIVKGWEAPLQGELKVHNGNSPEPCGVLIPVSRVNMATMHPIKRDGLTPVSAGGHPTCGVKVLR